MRDSTLSSNGSQAQPKWLKWAKELQSISQIGLHFTQNIFDRERYAQIAEMAVDIMATYTSTDTDYIRGLFDKQTGYATPKVDVRGVVFKDDAILLVREKLDDGRWTLPGGWADVNDTPSQAVVREIYEETGYRAHAAKILAVYDRVKQGHPPYPFSVYKLYFLCEVLSDTPDPHPHDHETGESAFFHEDQIPADISTMRVTKAQIMRFFEHHHQPDLPTDFD